MLLFGYMSGFVYKGAQEVVMCYNQLHKQQLIAQQINKLVLENAL